jgi:predicted  nucleic acid-binding Zn-ribbon protein
MKRAMERHAAGEALVMPVILRPVDWQSAPFGKVQAYPKNAKPVTTWANRDEAFLDVAQSIRKAVKKMTTTQAQPGSATVSATVIEQESTGLTTRQRRRLEQERDELQEQYSLLSEEIQHLRKSLRIDDLSPKERFRVEKQIEEAEAEREQISERIENLENKIE